MPRQFPMAPILSAFLVVLRERPFHALAILGWWLTGRRVRARYRLGSALTSQPARYRLWLSRHQAGGTTFPSLPRRDRAGSVGLALHLHVRRSMIDAARMALPSTLEQLSTHDRLYVTSEAGLNASALGIGADDCRVHFFPDGIATRAAGLQQVLDATQASYLLPLDPSTALTPGAVEVFAGAVAAANCRSTIFYADQDELDDHGQRSNPWLKPEWDEDLFLAQDYLSRAIIIPTDMLRHVIADVQTDDALVVYDVVARLALTPSPPPIEHIAYVAVTTANQAWRMAEPGRADLLRKLLAARPERIIVPAPVITRGSFGTMIVTPPLPDPPPRVSVIIPTRDRLDLLATSVEGILRNTDYPDIELMIVDNGSVEAETLRYLDECRRDGRAQVLRWPHPYNYSRINNFAAAQASGAYLCLLNNDTEIIDPSWLRAMMRHAVRPEAGAIGARLLYADGSIQHAGVVVGLGGAAGHAHRGLASDDPGYFAQAFITRGTTAVTAACMVLAKAKFEAVGGLDEDELAIAYNDVDLCLKLRAAGWRNLYVAQATLIHHESKSRGLDLAPEQLPRYRRELASFQKRWQTIGFRDPMHHPALDAASETYRLRI